MMWWEEGRIFGCPPQPHRGCPATGRGRRAPTCEREPPARRRVGPAVATALGSRPLDGARVTRIASRRRPDARSRSDSGAGDRIPMSVPAILDTSIFVVVEHNRRLARPLPDQVGVSVITLAKLQLGRLLPND